MYTNLILPPLPPSPPSLQSNIVSCQEGALDNIKLTASGEQGQLLKQLLNNGASGAGAGGIRVIRRCAMTTLVSARHQHLVISQDKGKVIGGVVCVGVG